MKMHELDITIRPDGKVSIHIEGVKGAGCDEYVKLFENLLNSEADVERTSEFYESEGVTIQIDAESCG